MSEFSYNFTSQQGIINTILSISSVIQTILFVYHYFKHDKTSKLPHMHEYLEIFAVVFFIIAIILSEMSLSWNRWMMFDVTLDSYIDNVDDTYNYIIPWMGICLVIIGNVLFIEIDYYLNLGVQAPLFLNDISIHKIDVNVTHVDDQNITLQIIGDENDADLKNKQYWNNKELVMIGPYKYCRHPIYLVWASWEFGYLLCTGHWFEYLSFTLFIFVEALRIDIIDKSLLYKYKQTYVDYVTKLETAFVPFFIGKYCCSINLAYCMCCCIGCRRYTEYQHIIDSDAGNVQNVDAKTVNLLVNTSQ
eukprot:4924_1